MNQTILRGAGALALAAAMLFVSPDTALAHSGEGASMRHIAIEMGLWAIGIIAMLSIVVAVFWVRAVALRRPRS